MPRVTRDDKFRHAAWAFLIYGLASLVMDYYLHRVELEPGTGMEWFIGGTVVVLVFPWLIAGGAEAKFNLLFTRVVTILVLLHTGLPLGHVFDPGFESIPLPGGRQVETRLAAAVLLAMGLITVYMLARAAWSSRRR